ncbi:MAG: hypothetical protein EOP88_26185 [Verrucomicrobiaceae bacterium]|nr:MAG: hypothetical protein EOP88_26185 [Verrucomicrobiaceae bacterium]
MLLRTVRDVELHPADGSEGYKIWLYPTHNEQSSYVRGYLLKSIQSLSIDGSAARFVISDKAGFGIGGGFRDENRRLIASGFTLSSLGDKVTLSEYHGGTVLTLREVRPDAVVLSYLHTFSGYNGHGGQLIRQDTGELTLAPFGNP